MSVYERKLTATVRQMLGHAGAPCNGYLGFYEVGIHSTPVAIPNEAIDALDLGADAVVEITITVRAKTRGKPRSTKCQNPWPAHVHNQRKATP